MKIATKISSIIAVCIMMMLVLFVGFLPVEFASAKSADEYETFALQREKMLEYNNFDDVTLDKSDYVVENDKIYLSKKAVGIYGLSKGNLNGEFYECDDESVVLEDGQVKIKETSPINRLIVVANDKIDSHGAVLKAEINNFHFFQYNDAEEAADAFEFYKNSGLSVSYDYVISTNSTDGTQENELSYKTPWAERAIGFQQYTENMLKIHPQETLKDVVVAVLDTGLYAQHVLFENRIYPGGHNFSGEGSSSDTHDGGTGHGSHVAGIIADSTKFQNIKILPLKVLKSDGKGNVGMIIDAIEYLVNLRDPKVRLLNLSVGITMEDPTVSVENTYLVNAIKLAYNNNIIPVVAAGNDKTSTTLSCPGNVTEAIVVSALRAANVGRDNESYVFDSSYSNYGPHVDFAAPGTGIYSAGISSPNAYVSKDGTSMATPFVSAVLCLIFTNPSYSGWDFDDVYELLATNAVDKDAVGRDDKYGWGIINIQNIGLEIRGEVKFSEEEVMKEHTFDLSLSYEETLPQNASYKIYYSTQDVDFVDSRGSEYVEPLQIYQTTRVTATAYVYDNEKNILFTSRITSKTYYFDNIDVKSNFEIEKNDTGILSHYNGVLEVLDMRSFQDIKGISSNAFANSNVKELYLPNSISLIADYAFNKSETLEKISCHSNNLQIGNRAFYMCDNLSSVDFTYARQVGELAFAYCTSLKKLYLPNAFDIGRNAFAGAGIEDIMFGKGLTNLQEERIGSLNIQKVYGFAGTPAKDFAALHKIDFVDLTLRFTKEYEYPVIDKLSNLNGENKITLKFIGLGDLQNGITNYSFRLDNRIAALAPVLSLPENFEQTMEIPIGTLASGTHTLIVTIIDGYNTPVSTTVKLDIVSESLQPTSLNKIGDDVLYYDLFVNGQAYSENTHLYSGKTYTIQFVAKDGFYLQDIMFDNQSKTDEPFTWTCGSDSVTATADAIPFDTLKVYFYTDGSVDVVIKGSEMPLDGEFYIVPRNTNLSFKIVQKEGYDFLGVSLNDVDLECVDGYYTIENVTTDKIVEIKYIEKYYDIEIVWGKGFLVSTNNFSQIKHGDSRTFVVTPEDGYAVDSVTVNGRQIDVFNNTFTLDNVKENVRVIVTFKQTVPSFLSSTIMPYFWVLFALFMIFVIAIIVLRIYRKKHKK